MNRLACLALCLAACAAPDLDSVDLGVKCDDHWKISQFQWLLVNDCTDMQYVSFLIDDPCGEHPTINGQPDWDCRLDPEGGIASQPTVECVGTGPNAGFSFEANPEYAFWFGPSPTYCLWGFTPDGHSPY